MGNRGIQVLFVMVVALVLNGAAAHAQVTHMGQKPSDHVMLESTGVEAGSTGCSVDFAPIEFKRNLLDGTTEQIDGFFHVPTGKVLVVTDVDWSYQTADGSGAGTTQLLRLAVQNIATGEFFPAAASTVTLNSEGMGAAIVSMTSGVVVSSKARLCAAVSPGPEDRVNYLLIRGYLTKDEK